MNLQNRDCIELMRETPNNYFDISIVDPPYGIGNFQNKLTKSKHKKIDWNNSIPSKIYFDELYRISKNTIIFGGNYFSQYMRFSGLIIHDKSGGGYKKSPNSLSNADVAFHSFNNTMRVYSYIWQGNVQGNTINWKNEVPNKRIHPCQKPVELYRWILLNYAKKTDKIFDSHAGSGSLAIACMIEGHNYTGCEIDKNYFELAQKRISDYSKQFILIQ